MADRRRCEWSRGQGYRLAGAHGVGRHHAATTLSRPIAMMAHRRRRAVLVDTLATHPQQLRD
ncbi:hypothetical protein [uncultured Cutibacterium sp.]|uniref:hypothetical protein n=1 Tax=uncultured Cutibacterium sp. TaxID=1912223 RepID=UPI0028061ED0|nr:hypothetical protein [uncultured Cutibacterium sp.]MDU1582001.1 hypothetical protein [Cutibacterium granulosum]